MVISNDFQEFISEDALLEHFDIPLPGTTFDIVATSPSFAGVGITVANGQVTFQIGSALDILFLPAGESVQDYFEFTVRDDLGNEVDLIGSYTIRSEDIL